MTDRHDPIVQVLRELDPVDAQQIEGATDEQARAELAAAVIASTADEDATPGGSAVALAGDRPGWARRSLAVAASLVVLLAVVVGGWPTGTPPVVADWTAAPQPLSEVERSTFDDWCRAVAPADLLDGAELGLADQRGRMIVGTYLDQDGRTSQCQRYERAAGDPEREPIYVGSASRADDPLDPDTDGPIAAARAGGAFQYPPERVASARIHGLVREEVDTLIGTLDDGRTFAAAIDDGSFHGWWPQECPSLWRPGWWAPDWFRSDDPRDACSPWLVSLDAYGADGSHLDRWTVPAAGTADSAGGPVAVSGAPPRG